VATSVTVEARQDRLLSLHTPEASKELGYHPFWEDTPVTLQVALIGTDGILLASDRKTVVRGNGLVDQSFLSSKILIDSAQGIAIAHSGNQISHQVAELILSDPAPVSEKLSTPKLQSFATEVWNRDESRPFDWHGELLIICKNNLDRIIKVSLGPLLLGKNIEGARAERALSYDKICAGHASNPAIFFSEHYYPNVKKRVSQLVFLAAHLILTGSRINPNGIEGLEIVKCTSSGFERLAESLVAELVGRSDELDTWIRNAILTPRFGLRRRSILAMIGFRRVGGKPKDEK
jgi:hypothetical protein